MERNDVAQGDPEVLFWGSRKETPGMPLPTFSADVLVYIELRGIPRHDFDRPEFPELPPIPDDRGVIRALFAWEREQDIRPRRVLLSGGGRYEALYERRDAARVTAWLKQRSSRIVEEPSTVFVDEDTKPGAG